MPPIQERCAPCFIMKNTETAAKKQCMVTEGGQLPAQCKEQSTILSYYHLLKEGNGIRSHVAAAAAVGAAGTAMAG